MQGFVDYRKLKKPIDIEDIIVEIGFGAGDWLVKMATENKNQIFFGIEKEWIPINKLLKKIKTMKINNILCSRIDAYWAFQLLFKDKSVKEIVMNYPDPWFKKSHSERRLTRKENLYIFAKKLISNGKIKIRTDDYSFLDFTKEQAKLLNCFSIEIKKLIIKQPLTKYESKWLNMGKEIYDIILNKQNEPITVDIKKLREVELFPVKVYGRLCDIKKILNNQYKIEEGLYIKTFSCWQREENFAIEVLLSEYGFKQTFMVTLKNKGDYYIIDVSAFSEILKTEGVKKALNFLSKLIFEEST